MVDAILKLKAPFDADPHATLVALAELSLAMYGEGGNPDAKITEDFLGFVNTPVFGGYVTMRITEAYAMALEYIEANGGNPMAELIRVEWPTTLDTNGDTIPAVYAPITFPVEQFDIDGVSLGFIQQSIGIIGGGVHG
ncbi:hypothetical protein [Geopsychrobacter electrodiphilus]|uniref:hypothetical protein n=1 Tax=Geopsychrobacter electrodiphilus TaxID=225196 RepID=UPI0003731F6F|nr:hypothetical protein [Geopsychrobacter electrodiphilus]